MNLHFVVRDRASGRVLGQLQLSSFDQLENHRLMIQLPTGEVGLLWGYSIGRGRANTMDLQMLYPSPLPLPECSLVDAQRKSEILGAYYLGEAMSCLASPDELRAHRRLAITR